MDFNPADFAIVLICMATCGYCYILSKRLEALKNTKDGLGATIVAFSRAISEISSTSKATTDRTTELATELVNLIERAESACLKVSSATTEMESRHGQTVSELKAIHFELNSTLAQTRAVYAEQTTKVQKELDSLAHPHSNQPTTKTAELLSNELRTRTRRMKAIVDYEPV